MYDTDLDDIHELIFNNIHPKYEIISLFLVKIFLKSVRLDLSSLPSSALP